LHRYALLAGRRDVAAGTGFVDVHHHFVPPFWFEEVKHHISRQGGGRIVSSGTLTRPSGDG
jgi:hypothetical protein